MTQTLTREAKTAKKWEYLLNLLEVLCQVRSEHTIFVNRSASEEKRWESRDGVLYYSVGNAD